MSLEELIEQLGVPAAEHPHFVRRRQLLDEMDRVGLLRQLRIIRELRWLEKEFAEWNRAGGRRLRAHP